MNSHAVPITAGPSPEAARSPDCVLSVENLEVALVGKSKTTPILRKVSFTLAPGEILGIVGESGSGKSLTSMAIMRLLEPPARIVGGRVLFRGRNLAAASEEEMRSLRGRQIAMIFQDPAMTLNPLLRVETQMLEAITSHEPHVDRNAAQERMVQSLERVHVPAARKRLRAYPHELSGGMRQRVSIAIAMLHRPAVIIADEPTTALDVTVQAQILEEMAQLSRETGTALIWISHDLSLLSGFADRISVMYAGRIVEHGASADVIGSPAHPYSRGLIMSVPSLFAEGADIEPIPGSPPSIDKVPTGCSFRDRCARATPECEAEPPAARIRGTQVAACFHPFHEPLAHFE